MKIKTLEHRIKELNEQLDTAERKLKEINHQLQQLREYIQDAGMIMPEQRDLIIQHFKDYGRLKEFLNAVPGYHGSDISRLKHGKSKFLTDKIRRVLVYCQRYVEPNNSARPLRQCPNCGHSYPAQYFDQGAAQCAVCDV